jgi:RHS repeat-associated protein
LPEITGWDKRVGLIREAFLKDHYDGLGSTRQMTDDSGTVTKSYTYDSFGNVISSFGSVANSYGFTGEQQFNEADNLVFLRARYYDSKVGRFMSRDPIGYEDGANLYTYVLNNSINWVDPSGSIKIKPPRGLVSVGCMAAIVGACAVLCHNDYWDNPCDTWGDCMNKCASTVIDPRKSFGPDSNGVIRAVAIACGIAIIIGF